MNCRNTIYAAVLTVAAASCEKELDFEYHDIEAIPVIEATLTAGGADVALRLTTPMDEPMDLTCLTDAVVTLDDLTAGVSLTLICGTDGHFRSGRPGIPGHDYRLNVARQGKTYSALSRMGKGPEIDSLEFRWVSMPNDDVAVLQVAFGDVDTSADGDCYWIRLYRNGAFYQWTTVRDDRSVDGILYETVTTTMRDTDDEDDDDVLLDGDLVTVTVTHVSKAFYDYLNALTADSNGPRMFAGDFCLGYFLASEVSESSIVFHPDQIDYAE